MAGDNGDIMGGINNVIIQDSSLDNTNQQLNRHVHEQSGIIIDNVADFIFKRGDYTNTYIVVNTDGLPYGVQLFLVDENSNKLYSPVDSNGNWITTACSITVGDNDIITLPAQFTSDLSSHVPFLAGTYHWKLKFFENEDYSDKEIPLTVEIRDFKIWDVQTPQIYPNEDVKVKLKTYGDTLYPSLDSYNLSFVIIPGATFDFNTGIITYPNSIIDSTVGKHMKVISQANNCILDYEVVNPINFYSHQLSVSYSGVNSFNNSGNVNQSVGYITKTGNRNMKPKIYCNGNLVSQNISNYALEGANYSGYGVYFKLPPGKYYWEVIGNTTTCTQEYSTTGITEVNTDDCSIIVNGTISTYLYNTTPITNAVLTLIDNNNSIIRTGTTDNNGEIDWNIDDKIVYRIAAFNIDDEEIITSNNFSVVIRDDFSGLTNITPANRNSGGVISADNKTLTGTSAMGAFYDNVFQALGDYEISFKIANLTTVSGQGMRICIQSMDQSVNQTNNISEKYCYGIEINNGSKILDYNASGLISKTTANFNINSIIQFRVVNNTLTAICDGTTFFTKTDTWFNDNMRIVIHGWGTNSNAIIGITDFKVKNI